jgi:hypothetical protein
MPTAPPADSTAYAHQLAQWFDARVNGMDAKLDALGPHQFTTLEIALFAAFIVVALLCIGLLCRAIRLNTENKCGAFAKDANMASQNLTNLTTSIGTLNTVLGQFLAAVQNLIAAAGDDAALPGLQTTVDGLSSQVTTALGQVNAALPTPAPQAKT